MQQFLCECYVVQLQIKVLAPSNCAVNIFERRTLLLDATVKFRSAPKTCGMDVQIHMLTLGRGVVTSQNQVHEIYKERNSVR